MLNRGDVVKQMTEAQGAPAIGTRLEGGIAGMVTTNEHEGTRMGAGEDDLEGG